MKNTLKLIFDAVRIAIDKVVDKIPTKLSELEADVELGIKSWDDLEDKPFYESRYNITTEEKTVQGEIIAYGMMKVADIIDFDLNKIKFMSLKINDEINIVNAPLSIDYTESGIWFVYNGNGWFSYFQTQDMADNYWGSDVDNPFETGLYVWTNDIDAEIINVTYNFTYEKIEVHTIDPKYIENIEHTHKFDDIDIDTIPIEKGGTGVNTVEQFHELTGVNLKMDKENPTGTGSLSINRQENTVIGDNSNAIGNFTVANGKNMTSIGSYNYYDEYSYRISNADVNLGSISYYISDNFVFDAKSGLFNLVNPTYRQINLTTDVGKFILRNENGGSLYKLNRTTSSMGSNYVGCLIYRSEKITGSDRYKLFVVGNGADEDNRSNAHTLDWNGNAWYQGNIYIGGTSQDDENAKKLATEAYINEKFEIDETELNNRLEEVLS